MSKWLKRLQILLAQGFVARTEAIARWRQRG